MSASAPERVTAAGLAPEAQRSFRREMVYEDADQLVFTDVDSGVDYLWDSQREAWRPSSDETVEAVGKSDEEVEAAVAEIRAAAGTRKRGRQADGIGALARKAKAKESLSKPVSAVYVTNLPDDVTAQELEETFSKCGLIKRSAATNEPLIKLYRGPDGRLKGDALVTFFQPDSVQLAVTLLDDTPLRPAAGDAGQCAAMHVEAAVFATPSGPDPNPKPNSKKPASRAQRLAAQQRQRKQLEWEGQDDPTDRAAAAARARAKKFAKVVVLRHLFTAAELAADPALLLDLKEDVRSECEKLGIVTNVRLYEAADGDGAVTVRFRDEVSAAACVTVMSGRWFGGRRVSAQLFDGDLAGLGTPAESLTAEP